VWVVKKTSPFYQFPLSALIIDTSWTLKISRTQEPLGTVFALIIFNGVNISAYMPKEYLLPLLILLINCINCIIICIFALRYF
jgi:hypothetical protein